MAHSDDGDERSSLTRAHLWRRAVVVAVVGVVGVTYAASALVTAGPITPLSLELVPVASRVTEPYLVQNWQLFAPDPISEERGAVARVRCTDGTVTDYEDITSEHIDAIHASRFFPSRQSRLVSNSMFNIFLQDPYLARYREALDGMVEEGAPAGATAAPGSVGPGAEPGADELEALTTVTPEELELREQGQRVLANFAAWSLAQRCPDGVEAAQLRYVLHRFPRWSERHRWDEMGDVEILESAWQPVS